MKPLYFSLGWLFFIIGAIGVVLPVLPTTPFMLLSLWGFSKSSDKFHHWLYHHKFFGPTIQQWELHHVIPPAAKIMAIVIMTCSSIYLIFFSPIHYGYKICSVGLMAYGAFFILTKPSYPEKDINTVDK